MHKWKHVSDKKLSTRKRGVFRDKRHQIARILSSGGTLPLPSDSVRGHDSGGLEFSRVGFCVLTNDVICSYRKSAGFYLMDRCFECSELARFELVMEKEENEFFDEVDEIRRRFPT